MGIEEARSRLGLMDSRRADEIFLALKEEKVIKEENGCLSKKRFRVVLKEDEDAMVQEILKHYLEAGFALWLQSFI